MQQFMAFWIPVFYSKIGATLCGCKASITALEETSILYFITVAAEMWSHYSACSICVQNEATGMGPQTAPVPLKHLTHKPAPLLLIFKYDLILFVRQRLRFVHFAMQILQIFFRGTIWVKPLNDEFHTPLPGSLYKSSSLISPPLCSLPCHNTLVKKEINDFR